jgi:HlyD family type I secretion membrane fusion protein
MHFDWRAPSLHAAALRHTHVTEHERAARFLRAEDSLRHLLGRALLRKIVVKADGNRKTVQNQEGGIIRQILVKDGDRVHAGQTLVTIEDVRTDASLDNNLIQLAGERTRQARLLAERDMAKRPDFSIPADQRNAHVAEFIQRESALFTSRRHALDSQIWLIQKEIAAVNDEITALHTLANTFSESQALAENDTRRNQALKEQGFISDTRLMELQRTQIELRGRTETQATELARALQKKTGLESKSIALQNDYIQTATNELKETSKSIFNIEEQLRPIKDAKLRASIAAPVSGEIVDLKFHTIGAVISPREPIVDIAPDEVKLIIEARIKPENIRDIQIDSKADIRLTAYRQRTTPIIEGTVIYIGADRLIDKITNQIPEHVGDSLTLYFPNDLIVTSNMTTGEYLMQVPNSDGTGGMTVYSKTIDANTGDFLIHQTQTDSNGNVVFEADGRLQTDGSMNIDWTKSDGSHGNSTSDGQGNSDSLITDADGSQHSSQTQSNGSYGHIDTDPEGNFVKTWHDAKSGGDSISHNNIDGSSTEQIAYPDGTNENQYKNADGSYGSSTSRPDGSVSESTTSADGASSGSYHDANGSYGSSSADGQGNSQSAEFNADGSITRSQNHADGSSSYNSQTDANGNVYESGNDADGTYHNSYQNVDGSHSSNVTYSNGSSSNSYHNTDGSYGSSSADGQGNSQAESFDADGNVSHNWSKADGSYGAQNHDASGNDADWYLDPDRTYYRGSRYRQDLAVP